MEGNIRQAIEEVENPNVADSNKIFMIKVMKLFNKAYMDQLNIEKQFIIDGDTTKVREQSDLIDAAIQNDPLLKPRLAKYDH